MQDLDSLSYENLQLVNMGEKPVAIPGAIRRKIGNALHKMGNYFPSLPLDAIFAVCAAHGVKPVQEDGTPWSGIFCGTAECGSEKAKGQTAILQLALEVEGGHALAKQALSISWGTLNGRNGRTYEVVAYIN